MSLRKYTGTSYNDLNKAVSKEGFLANPCLVRIHHSPKNTSYSLTVFSLKFYLKDK